ncbi:MgtC/SapB family protein, partial [Candidatus Sumerlaeota bacterium]|nr:MgtC/SapB family protein [Candidatus Sumerlaeota bacterium]
RYAIRNPRDASTLVIALGLGMACGSGLLDLAVLGGVFIALISYVLDHFPQLLIFPRIRQREQMVLSVTTRSLGQSMEKIKSVFQRHNISYVLRTIAQKTGESKAGMSEIEMLVEYPVEISITDLTFELSDENFVAISWEPPRTTYY